MSASGALWTIFTVLDSLKNGFGDACSHQGMQDALAGSRPQDMVSFAASVIADPVASHLPGLYSTWSSS